MTKIYDQSVEINHNLNWPYIPDHPHRIFITGGSRSGKANVLLNLIKHQQQDIEKICLFVKDTFKTNYQLLIMRREKIGIETLNNARSFIDYSGRIDDFFFENLEDYNPTKTGEC